jgi:hypothetical protein
MPPIEERLRALEEEVARLKQQLPFAAQNGKWWERIAGSMHDVPEFEEVLRFGSEFRRRESVGEKSNPEP